MPSVIDTSEVYSIALSEGKGKSNHVHIYIAEDWLHPCRASYELALEAEISGLQGYALIIALSVEFIYKVKARALI